MWVRYVPKEFFVTFPWWLKNVKSMSKIALFSNERRFEIWFSKKRTITFFWSKLSKLHKKDPILHVATTFSLKQVETRTSHGPIKHPLSTMTRHAPYNVWSSKHPPAGCTLDGNVIVTDQKDTLLLRVASPPSGIKGPRCVIFPSSMCGQVCLFVFFFVFCFFFFYTQAGQFFLFFCFCFLPMWVKFFFFFFFKSSCSPLKSNGTSLT